ncbi:cysteine and histidine-rich protein 1-A-like [Stegodyphus dumicola]|uniref:cysteine and histidine-rich protein 1-A-like n=1 Tax=Stegodyphus dumicola TaxID=202533 RepID=UPI0015AFED70|nr:cysteine and histidine-rich protein 1-A-like [Stegodyphus dumicola]
MAGEAEQSNRSILDDEDFSMNVLNAYVKDQIQLASDLGEENRAMNTKLKEIFKCTVCEEVRRTPIYQCKYGHLICAGCFGDILLESRVQNEIATCPVCQTTINKDLCSRNVAAEKAILLLPRRCKFCNNEYRLHILTQHESEKCNHRRLTCPNYAIGCGWRGKVYSGFKHGLKCSKSSDVGYDILRSLSTIDGMHKDQIDLHNKLMELLSCEKFTHCDLQFKKCREEGNNIVKYETTTFCALENQWMIRCEAVMYSLLCNFQLVLKTKINNPINLQYMLNKGPYSDMDFKPKLHQFKFSDKSMESQREEIYFINKNNYRNFTASKRVNFRIFLFLSK